MNAPNQPSDPEKPRSGTADGSVSGTGSGADEPESGVAASTLLDPDQAQQVEEEDRKRPIPGGEPECPLCGTKMVRRVERHPAPHGGASPFRVRLVCPGESCGAWTVYDW